jgi:GABA(A) receptor-associated protein
MSTTADYKSQNSIEKRKRESQHIRTKYPDRVPVICEKAPKSKMPNINKNKFLVPADLSLGQFVFVIRKRMNVRPEQNIFIFAENVLPPASLHMEALYTEYKDEDGFLYLKYDSENVFG